MVNLRKSIFIFLGLITVLIFSASASLSSSNSKMKLTFQRGISYAAWSTEAYSTASSNESLSCLRETRAEWVAICVVWYQTNITTADIHPGPQLTPSNESIEIVIGRCHELGLRVMLKPMIGLKEPDQKSSDILPSQEWFENYANFINFFAEFANKNQVDLLCIGCEFTSMIGEEWRLKWEEIVLGVRERYSGPLIYAESWSAFYYVSWWDLVDYIGINAYFPLSEKKDPSLEELKNEWVKIADYIEQWQSTINKPIIFTEIGYQSVNGTNMQPWNSSLANTEDIDLQEQADCYEAAFHALWPRKWFYGFYWWYWETNPDAGGEFDKGYTPQNKPAQNVLTKWYSQERRVTDGLPWEVGFALAVGVTWVAIILMRLFVGRARKEMEEKEKPEETRENMGHKGYMKRYLMHDAKIKHFRFLANSNIGANIKNV